MKAQPSDGDTGREFLGVEKRRVLRGFESFYEGEAYLVGRLIGNEHLQAIVSG